MEKLRKVDLSSVIDLAIEAWRLQDRVRRLQSATGREDPSIAFSIDKIQHVLREIGIEAREYTGQTYNEGMSLDVLTFDYPVGGKTCQQNRARNSESGHFLRRNTLQDGSGDCRKGR